MPLDLQTLELLRQNHPAWRLLVARHAPFVVSVLARAFIEPNVRIMAQSDLIEALDDALFEARERLGLEAYPKAAREYLDDWASDENGWLRKFYTRGSDEPHFDLTPATEKAIGWLSGLADRPFIGTESRLLTLLQLLEQIVEGTEADPAVRTAELRRRRNEIDAEIARIERGDVSMLDDTAVKDRFQQFLDLARGLLADFREVEQNFRALDRQVRERIALWDGGKGALLEEVLGERDAIARSDQGASFRAFWDFLMSSRTQEELTRLLEHVLSLAPVAELGPDPRVRRIHHEWLAAGEYTQRTVAQLSQQLRRFLDDRTWQENRRILTLARSIESHAIALRGAPPQGAVMELDDAAAAIDLAMERPLYAPIRKVRIADIPLAAGDPDVDTSALFTQVTVDKRALIQRIRKALQAQGSVTIGELCARYPLRQGLAELLAFMEIAVEDFQAVVTDDRSEIVRWEAADGTVRYATVPIVRVGG